MKKYEVEYQVEGVVRNGSDKISKRKNHEKI